MQSHRPAFAAVLLLSLADAAMRLTFTGRRVPQDALLWVFDGSRETSLPTWFAVVAMACLGLRCWSLGSHDWRWRLPGLGFLYLSADDACMLHERLGALLQPWFGGHGVYSWILVIAPVFVVAGIAVFAWLWRTLGGACHRRALLLAGFAALGIALGLEVVEDRVIASGLQLRGIPLFAYDSWLEESLEMLAPILLLRALAGLPERVPAASLGR